jgi:CBS domain containing-hemolysin-like protein
LSVADTLPNRFGWTTGPSSRYNPTLSVEVLWKILATLALVALNGYFVAAEFAAVGARLSRLESQTDAGLLGRMATIVKRRLDLYLSGCQLGITIASLALGFVTESLLVGLVEGLFGHLGAGEHHTIAVVIGLTISTALHVVVGEQAPKNWAIRYADTMLPVVAPGLLLFTYVFYPLIWLLNAASHGILRLTGVKIEEHGGQGGLPHTEDELKGLLAQAVAQGTIAQGRGRLLTSAFEFNELKVRQIMTPRTQVEYLLLDQPIAEVLRIVRKSAYTRYPLCDKDIDHVVGLVHIKDLFNQLQLVPGKLRFSDAKTPDGLAVAIADGLPGSQVHVIGSADIDLRKIKREILFVPELLPAPRVLRQIQTQRVHMAVVVDEYGATQGIVTLEDVIEEIVGEIEDEFDIAARTDFQKDGKNFRVAGLFPLHELRERLALEDLDDAGDTVDTVGGYIVAKLNRWPRAGDTVEIGPYVAKVLTVQHRRVGQVLISPRKEEPAPVEGSGEASK